MSRVDRLLVAAGVVAALVCLLVPQTAAAQSGEEDSQSRCLNCHDDVVFNSPAHPDVACEECHTNVTPAHRRKGVEPLSDEESCGECHSRELRTIGRSVHDGQARCTECHGNAHEIHKNDDLASAVSPVNQIKYCSACHNQPPSLVNGYLASEHGKALLVSGLIDAPSCSDCHGDHAIRPIADDRAATSHSHSPELCGSCHLLLFEEWKQNSAHGQAWEKGESGPVCTDCHNSHAIADPTTGPARLASAENCGECHGEYYTTFRDSFHGKANDLGFVNGATCSDCHTPHSNLPADNPASSVHADNLTATCGKCHENITAAFTSYDPHNDPTDPNDIFAVYVVWVFMTGLLIGVFAFFGIHDLLWLQRSLVGVLRGEFDEELDSSGQYVKRFTKIDVRMHITIVTTFLLLALTGLPLKFHAAPWAQPLMNLLGGVDMARLIHRLAAIGTFGYAIVHLGQIFVRRVIRHEGGMFWGPKSMVPQPQDIKDLSANMRYFLYLGKQPEGDRWTYFEKFDYLAVFWGIMIIGFSGLMLWIPDVFTTVLPGWTLNAAYVIHSDEALLATGFIFIFHFFHTHLRPESFPMDIVIFTGKMPLSRLKTERPREYQRLVELGKLDEYLVEAPTKSEVRNAYIIGTIFLTIGIVLAIGIIWALLIY